MGTSSQPLSIYENKNRPQTLVERLKICSNDDGAVGSWESLLDSTCTQLDIFDDDEFNEFQDLLIRLMFLDDDIRRSKKVIKVCGGLLYHIISVVDITDFEDYLELMQLTCITLPVDVAIFIHPLMFKAIVDKLRSNKLKCGSLFADQDLTRFATAFAMELGSSAPEDTHLHEYGVFWKAAFDTYSSEHCESFDLKVFFAFLGSRPYLQLYLQKGHENRIKLYQCLVGTIEKKPSCISFKMACLLLIYIWDLNFDEKDWKNVALYVRKLYGFSIHTSAAIRNLVNQAITAFLGHVRAPREEYIQKLQNQVKLGGTEDTNIKSAAKAKPSQPSGNLEETTRYVDLLQQLVGKMKSKNVRMTSDSDKQKLKTIVRDLNSFL